MDCRRFSVAEPASTALGNVAGVYVIADRATGKLYVGSATGESGLRSRWSEYSEHGHGSTATCLLPDLDCAVISAAVDAARAEAGLKRTEHYFQTVRGVFHGRRRSLSRGMRSREDACASRGPRPTVHRRLLSADVPGCHSITGLHMRAQTATPEEFANDVRRGMEKLLALSNEEKREWLVEHGNVTEAGSLHPRYGGEREPTVPPRDSAEVSAS